MRQTQTTNIRMLTRKEKMETLYFSALVTCCYANNYKLLTSYKDTLKKSATKQINESWYYTARALTKRQKVRSTSQLILAKHRPLRQDEPYDWLIKRTITVRLVLMCSLGHENESINICIYSTKKLSEF